MANPIIVPRLFTELSGQSARSENLPLSLDSFSDRTALVVLGDPGSGKTTSLEQAAKEEPKGEFVTLRQFRRTRNLEKFYDRVLFIDALDEVRARAGDGSAVLDDLIGRLEELVPLRRSPWTRDDL